MKKVKFILGALLVAMLFFTAHDYILTQVDLADGSKTQKTLVKAEHSVFHTPMILTSCESDFSIELAKRTIYPLKNYTPTQIKNLLFKPPTIL